MTFPYPGDDPGGLLDAAATFNGGQPSLGLVGERLGEAAASMRAHWQADSAELANADLNRVQTAVAEAGRDLGRAGSAVDAYRSVLLTVRAQIDDLRTRHSAAQNQLEAAQADAQRLAHADDQGATPGQLAADQADLSDAQAAARHEADTLEQEYQRLVRRADAAAAECTAELLATIHGHVHDEGHARAVSLEEALGVNEFGLLRADQARVAAGEAAALSDEITHLPPGDPKIAQLAAKLHAILDKNAGDPYFATPYLTKIGSDGLYRLTAALGAAAADHGAATQHDIAAVQRDLGADLGAATRYSGDHVPNPQRVPQVTSDWIDHLLHNGAHLYDVTDPASLSPLYRVPGYQLLGVLLHTGQYDAAFLGRVGNGMHDYEQHHGGDGGAWTRGPYGPPSPVRPDLRLWWGDGAGPDADTGADPFDGWDGAMGHSPAAARQVLSTQHDLLNYLLNDRSWQVRDYPVPDGSYSPLDGPPASWPDGQQRRGLTDLGQMLDTVIGTGAHDPQSARIYHDIVVDLGDAAHNHRIGDVGHFVGTDWIPPELRPSLADLTAKNIDMVHASLSDQPVHDPTVHFTGEEGHSVKNVLADLGKSGYAHDTLRHAEIDYASTLIANKIGGGDNSYGLDADGMGRTTSLLDYGATQHASAAQQAADAAHNQWVDRYGTAGGYLGQAGLDAVPGLDQIPGAGPVASGALDKLIGLVTGAHHVDHSQQVNIANADLSAHSVDLITTAAREALYRSVPHDQLTTIFDGAHLDYAHYQNVDYNHLPAPVQDGIDKWIRHNLEPAAVGLPSDVETSYDSKFGNAEALLK